MKRRNSEGEGGGGSARSNGTRGLPSTSSNGGSGGHRRLTRAGVVSKIYFIAAKLLHSSCKARLIIVVLGGLRVSS